MLQKILRNTLWIRENMMINYILIFLIGSFLGYLMELFYRNVIFHEHFKPGFLKGPYLPLYGFGILILYILSSIDMNIWVRIFLYGFLLTLLEILLFVKIHDTNGIAALRGYFYT